MGIDVSKYQGKIDWNLVKKDGIDFVMLRAGFRGYGQSGSLNEDSMFDEYIQGAKSAGLDVGVYFFSQAKNEDEGIKEAEYTIELIKNIILHILLHWIQNIHHHQIKMDEQITFQFKKELMQ